MNDRANFVLTKRALDQPVVANIAANHFHLRESAAVGQFRLRNPIANDAGHIGAGRDQPFHEPRADEAGAPSNERRAVQPKLWVAIDHQIEIEREILGAKSFAARKLSGKSVAMAEAYDTKKDSRARRDETLDRETLKG